MVPEDHAVWFDGRRFDAYVRALPQSLPHIPVDVLHQWICPHNRDHNSIHSVKDMLDDMHLAKIDMADEIYVINPGGYVGQSTAREIAYARCCGKPVRSICPLPAHGTDTKGVLKVVIGKETREYIRKAARESGCTDDIAVENIVREHTRHAKTEQGIPHED